LSQSRQSFASAAADTEMNVHRNENWDRQTDGRTRDTRGLD